MRKAPRQKPGKSRQDYGTPHDFLHAVESRFGEIAIDLAAHADNAVTSAYFDPTDDSLSMSWREALDPGDIGWLNPPFAKIGVWAAKCVEESEHLRGGARILMLVPAAVGSNWFRAHVNRKAYVHVLSPRLIFTGETHSFPKDLMLVEYGAAPGLDCWRWKEVKKREKKS